ncbi:MAG: OmpA family protein [Desulfatibacillaceae bacterium]
MFAKHFRIFLALLVVCPLFLPEALFAGEKGKDHPLLTRMPGYQITEYQSGFGAKAFPVPTDEEDVYDERRVEGARTLITYEIPDGGDPANDLDIVRNYSNALKSLGGTVLFENDTQTNYRANIQGRDVWVQASSFNGGEMYELTVVEIGEVTQVVEAGSLGAAIDRDGHVAVYINFDSGKAYVKADSRKAVEEIAALMQSRPKLRLRVEGHTDDVGDDQANMILSEARAGAVVNVLSFLGVDTSRLEPAGLGETTPIADNGTEEGRAKNRRVELVRM